MLQLFSENGGGAVIWVHGVPFVLVVVGCSARELEIGELILILFDELRVDLDNRVYRFLVGESFVEVADVLRRVHLRNVLRSYLHIVASYLHVVKFVPIHVFEPGMALDVFRTAMPESLFRVLVQKTTQETSAFW